MNAALTKAAAYLRQKTTITGLGGMAIAIVGYAQHTLTAPDAITAAVGAAVLILIPENPTLQADVVQVSGDAAAAYAAKGSATSLTAITADMIKLSHDLPPGTPVVPVAPVVTSYQLAVAPTIPSVPVPAPALTPANAP